MYKRKYNGCQREKIREALEKLFRTSIPEVSRVKR